MQREREREKKATQRGEKKHMAAGFPCVFIWFLNIILPEVKDTPRIGAKLSDFWKRLEKYRRGKKDICVSESPNFAFAATSNWAQKMNKLKIEQFSVEVLHVRHVVLVQQADQTSSTLSP